MLKPLGWGAWSINLCGCARSSVPGKVLKKEEQNYGAILEGILGFPKGIVRPLKGMGGFPKGERVECSCRKPDEESCITNLLTNAPSFYKLEEKIRRDDNLIIANELRRGVIIKVENELYVVLAFQHVKPGKGGAFMKTKLRNIKKSVSIEKTFRADEKVEDIYIDKRKMQYLYNDGDNAVFMDLETFEQESISNECIEEEIKFLKEGQEVEVSFYENEIIAIDLPIFVELKVVYTEPGLKGDTATSSFKPAQLETGSKIQVPLFINENDRVKIDTRTGEYIERV